MKVVDSRSQVWPTQPWLTLLWIMILEVNSRLTFPTYKSVKWQEKGHKTSKSCKSSICIRRTMSCWTLVTKWIGLPISAKPSLLQKVVAKDRKRLFISLTDMPWSSSMKQTDFTKLLWIKYNTQKKTLIVQLHLNWQNEKRSSKKSFYIQKCISRM